MKIEDLKDMWNTGKVRRGNYVYSPFVRNAGKKMILRISRFQILELKNEKYSNWEFIFKEDNPKHPERGTKIVGLGRLTARRFFMTYEEAVNAAVSFAENRIQQLNREIEILIDKRNSLLALLERRL